MFIYIVYIDYDYVIVLTTFLNYLLYYIGSEKVQISITNNTNLKKK